MKLFPALQFGFLYRVEVETVIMIVSMIHKYKNNIYGRIGIIEL